MFTSLLVITNVVVLLLNVTSSDSQFRKSPLFAVIVIIEPTIASVTFVPFIDASPPSMLIAFGVSSL